jgi:wobble nucleotide-excising tRNase
MIKKIKKIKNLGIFNDYTCCSNLPEFKRYNLFYGWNGSGKSTLSNLFSSFNDGKNLEYDNLEYEMVCYDNNTIKQNELFSTKIRVFNENYIKDNIGIIDSKFKSIFILGAENKKLADEISEDEEQLKKLKKEKNDLEQKVETLENNKGKKFTEVAKLIGSNFVGSATRNYRKPDAEKDYEKLESKKILKYEEVSKLQIILRQEQKELVNEIEYSFNLDKEYHKTIELCKKTVKSKIISDLKENIEISDWVEKGIELNQKFPSKTCKFCNNELSNDRINDLIEHFNKADQELKNEIDTKIEELKNRIKELEEINVPDKIYLYNEFHTIYNSNLISFNKEKINIKFEISSLIETLESKKSKRTELVNFNRTLTNHFLDSIKNLNSVIKENNNKSTNFQKEKDEISLKLKNHYLSEIYDEVETFKKEIISISNRISEIDNGSDETISISQLTEKIKTNKATISSEHKACQELNHCLCSFLGRKELEFEVSEEGGYILKRKNKIAKNLSEGEKTAIAFIYFVVHLKDQEFNPEQGIIVIDDPISSLDSNCLFQAFSFLKNSVKDAKQVFLLTHNFDFLKLLLNWLNNFPEARENKGGKSYFMINHNIINGERNVQIVELDKLLRNHQSEYHYLCKKIFEYSSDGTIETAYQISNIARKVLETFLMFFIPNNDKLYLKMEKLNFDKVKKDAIYKFVNDQSHITGDGFDPSLVQETEKNIKYLLEMMKTVFPEHYNILENEFKSN